MKMHSCNVAILALALTASGCASNKTSYLTINSLPAINATEKLARHELDCHSLTGFIQSSQETEAENTFWAKQQAEYTIRMRGCEKEAIYQTVCLDTDDCHVTIEAEQLPVAEESE